MVLRVDLSRLEHSSFRIARRGPAHGTSHLGPLGKTAEIVIERQPNLVRTQDGACHRCIDDRVSVERPSYHGSGESIPSRMAPVSEAPQPVLLGP